MSHVNRSARWGQVIGVGLMLATAACREGSEDASSLSTKSEALFSTTGVQFWNTGSGTPATIPMCFVVRPILRIDGSIRCPNQTSSSDCDGNTVDNGTTLSPSAVRQQIRTNVEDTWSRYANIEFTNWGDCAIDAATNRHIEANLANWVMIELGPHNFADFLGKPSAGAAHIQYHWVTVQAQADHDVFNIIHEVGHMLGFEHEWQRPDFTGWKCGSGPMISTLRFNCIEPVNVGSDGSAASGSPVQINTCNGGNAQKWQQGWAATQLDGTLTAAGKCLEVVGGGTAAQTPVQMNDCNAGPAQQWVLRTDRTVFNPQSGRCLDVPSGVVGAPLQIYDCAGGDNQTFTAPGGPITSGIDGNKCLDVPNGLPTNGSRIQIYDCNPGNSQSFTQGFNGTQLDGTLRVLGKCLDIVGGGTANNTPVQLSDCNGGANQKWALQFDGSIKNPQSGRCLDLPGFNTTNGTQLEIYDCNGGANQKWNVPNNETGQAFGTPPDVGSIMQYCVVQSGRPVGLSSWDILGAQALYGRKYSSSLVGYRAQCVATQNGSTATGAAIVGAACRGGMTDSWSRDVTSVDRFANFANPRLCLKVKNGVAPNPLVSATCDTSGAETFTTLGVEWRAMGNLCVKAIGSGLQIQPCDGSSAEKWDFFHVGGGIAMNQIRQSGTSLCVASTTTTGAQGQALVLATCSSTDTRQRFSPVGGGALMLSNNSNLCAYGGSTTPGTPLVLSGPCSARPVGSQFTLRGKVMSLSNCMTSGSAPGQAISDSACNSSNTTTQVWEYFF